MGSARSSLSCLNRGFGALHKAELVSLPRHRPLISAHPGAAAQPGLCVGRETSLGGRLRTGLQAHRRRHHRRNLLLKMQPGHQRQKQPRLATPRYFDWQLNKCFRGSNARARERRPGRGSAPGGPLRPAPAGTNPLHSLVGTTRHALPPRGSILSGPALLACHLSAVKWWAVTQNGD